MSSTTTDRRLGLTGSAAIKVPCKAATIANITLSAAQTIDGVSCVAGDRVLVKSQTSSVDNGIYVVDTGTWTRDLDFDGVADVVTGTIVMVLNGSTNANTYWRLATTGTVTFGTSAITFAAALAGDSAMVTFLPSGTLPIATNLQVKIRRDVPQSPEDRGCVGDGVTDDTTNFGTFLDNANNKISVLTGTYKLASLLTKPLTNSVFIGIPGTTKITGAFGYQLLKFAALNNVSFWGITFENTYTNAVDGATAQLMSQGFDVINTFFRFCKFTAPNANIDGLGFYPRTTFADTTAAKIDGLWIEDCTFQSIGRIGCTLMSRGGGADKYTNARRIYFNRNKCISLGLSGSYGFGLTLDGFGSDVEACGNEIWDCLLSGIENTGFINAKICDNKGMSFANASTSLISLDGTDAVNGNRPLLGQTVTGNRCLVACTAAQNIYDCTSSYFANNYWWNNAGQQAALLRRTFKTRFSAETYLNAAAGAKYALLCDTTSSNNRWDGNCVFDDSAASAQNSVVRFGGASTDNIINNGAIISKGTGGNSFDQIDTASLNYVEGFLNSWTPTIAGASTPGTPTYSVQAGHYTLIGKLCTFALRITTTAVTGMVGDVRISLPFTSANSVNGVQAQITTTCAIDTSGITIAGTNKYFVGDINPNAAYIVITEAGSTADATTQSSQLAASTTIIVSGSFVIA